MKGEVFADSVIRLGNVGSTAPKRRIIHKGQVAWMKPANERRWEHDTPKAVGARHATNEEAMEKETMEKEPHLTQMRLALTDISSDPAELCALPGMRGPRQLATFAVAKYFRPGCPFLYGGSPWQA